jgi:hypothetical protein
MPSSILDLPDNPANINPGKNPVDNRSFEERVEEVIQDHLLQGGLELPQNLERLVKIFGPGSKSVANKLLSIVSSDKSTWDIAIGEASLTSRDANLKVREC